MIYINVSGFVCFEAYALMVVAMIWNKVSFRRFCNAEAVKS